MTKKKDYQLPSPAKTGIGKLAIWLPLLGLVIVVASAAVAIKAANRDKGEKVAISPTPPLPPASAEETPKLVLPSVTPEPLTPAVENLKPETTEPPEDTSTTPETKPKPLSIPLPVSKVATVDYQRNTTSPQYYAALPLEKQPRLYHWFGGIPSAIHQDALDPGPHSNIRRQDYAGAESCKDCHSKNYKRWDTHAHKRMNAWATPENVVGDFTDTAEMFYMGGHAKFFRDGSAYRMSLERDGVKREFNIERTIGSRFFQYYIGKLISGPEPDDHQLRKVDHVLPLGYWMEPSEWVPIVNIGPEKPDEQRADPFVNPSDIVYDKKCSACHTTRPLGDLFLYPGMMSRFDAYGPRVMHFSTEQYLAEEHPELIAHMASSPRLTTDQIVGTLTAGTTLPAKDHAVNLGISCEGCHNGAAEHARNKKQLPAFFPRSRHLVMAGKDSDETWGRNNTNINWACSRCHSGGRQRYANGISTWNSTELSDAARGSCYDPVKAQHKGMEALTCVHCHDPHTGIGKKWPRTAQQDTASCTDCHKQFNEPAALQAHTHHLPASEGSECMNCHMPRINEGLQDMVRTHTIFSPTESNMLKANQPNACNICHVEKPIDWTMTHLKDWYGTAKIPAADIAANYPLPTKAAVLNWLKNEHHGSRLVAADALTHQNAHWAIDHVIKALDDPYLINRQFAARGLEKMTGIDARDHGYRFYMFKEERAGPLAKLRKALPKGSSKPQR